MLAIRVDLMEMFRMRSACELDRRIAITIRNETGLSLEYVTIVILSSTITFTFYIQLLLTFFSFVRSLRCPCFVLP